MIDLLYFSVIGNIVNSIYYDRKKIQLLYNYIIKSIDIVKNAPITKEKQREN